MAGRKQQTGTDVLEATARVPQHVVHRSFAHETVVLNLKTGRYHGLNPTAGQMLAELDTGTPVGEVAKRLAEIYERPLGEIEQDLTELCLDLLARELIELTGTDGKLFDPPADEAQ